jgi:hypothetical protein
VKLFDFWDDCWTVEFAISLIDNTVAAWKILTGAVGDGIYPKPPKGPNPKLEWRFFDPIGFLR